jgi:hypothetical protein
MNSEGGKKFKLALASERTRAYFVETLNLWNQEP